jgi:TIR domain
MKYDIFISHTASEFALAEAFKNRIELDFADFNIFISSDDTSITSSSSGWMKQIESAIIQSKFMLVLCSHDSVKRPWLAFEAGAAWIRTTKNIDGEDISLCEIMPVCHGGLTKNELPNPYNAFQVASIDLNGIGRIYNNISRIFNKKIRSSEQLTNTISVLEAVDKTIVRTKITAKLLDKADSAGVICYRQDSATNEYLILLVRTKSRDRWIFPKGSITAGSDHFKSIEEELKDEAGIFADIQKNTPIFLDYIKGNGTTKHLVLYPAKHVSSFIAKERELRGDPIWVKISNIKEHLKEGREKTQTLKGLELAFDNFLKNIK